MTRARTSAALLRSVEHEHQLAAHRKTCAAVTCREQVRVGRIFCPNHWFFLPYWLRQSIIKTFRDAEWPQHQDAIRLAADLIDRAALEAREQGFTHLKSATENGKPVRYIGRRIA